jgi:hypothetical protein
MMTMVNGPSAASSASNINYRGAMTPDALMAYCSSRLKGIDDQMYAQFDKQQAYRNVSAALNKLQAKYSEQASNGQGVDWYKGDHAKTYGEIEDDWNAVMAALPTDSPERAALQAQRDKYNDSEVAGNGPEQHQWTFSAQQCTDMATSLGDVSKNISSGAELDMINLQSIMSQRQTAIQLCTNLVSALDESQKATAQKIGS